MEKPIEMGRIQQIYEKVLLLGGEPRAILDQIVCGLADFLQAKIAIIEKLEQDKIQVISMYLDGKIFHEGEFLLRGTPCEHVKQEKRSCHFHRAYEQFPQDPFLQEHRISFYVGVPIFDHAGEVIGIVNAMDPKARELPEEELQVIRLLGQRAALELGSLLLEQESRRLREKLLEIGREILQQREVDAILRQVASAIREHSPFKLVAISLFERPIDPHRGEQERIAQVVTAGLSLEEEAKLKALALSGQPIPSHQILQKGRPIGGGYYVTPELLPELVPKGVKGRVGREGAGVWGPYDDLYFFLRQGEQLIGRISLGDPVHGQVPTPRELEPLELFVNLATLALEKARFTQELQHFQRRLQGIYRLSEQLARLEDFATLIQQAVEVIRQNFEFDHVVLFLKEGEELVLKSFHTRLPLEEFRLKSFQRLRLDQGICGWVAREKQPARVGDVLQDPRYVMGHPQIRSELAVPILLEEEPLGVLNIESLKPNAFTPEDVELLQAVARQLAVAIGSLRRRQELKELLHERERVNRFLKALNQGKSLEEMLRLIIQQGIELLAPKANAGSFLLWDEPKKCFEFQAAINRDLGALKSITFTLDQIRKIARMRAPYIFTRSQQLSHPELGRIVRETGQWPPGSTICVPIGAGEKLIAVLNINNLEEEGVFTPEDAQKLVALVPEIELALARAQDQERLKELAIRDPLTGAYNRHYFTEFIGKEQERAKRYGYPISLVMIDMDDFYEINDRFGHATGDRVLQEIAQLIMNNVRAPDVVVRYGGDEFLIVMPQTAQKEAEEAMERLRQRLEIWDVGLKGRKLSMSFGVASWSPQSTEHLEQVLEKADQFMYRRRRIVRGGGGRSAKR